MLNDLITTQKSLIVNIGVASYFIGIAFVNQFSGIVASAVWYIALTAGMLSGIYAHDFKIGAERAFFAIIVFGTGLLNILVIGTTSLKTQFLLLSLLVLSLAMDSKYISEKTALCMVYLNCFIVIFKFLTVGFWGQVYLSSSTNFVSVYLLYPTLLYYVILEKNSRKLDLIPGFLVWGLSILSRGRGGIIATSFFLVWIVALYLDRQNKAKLLIIAIIILTIIVVAFLFLENITTWLGTSVITEYFRDRGLRSSRLLIWKDYLNKVFSDLFYLLFGPNMENTIALVQFGGNPHNSLINIHIHNGIIMVLVIVCYSIRNTVNSIKKKQLVYLGALLTALIRAFTDNVFWPTYGTAILFFLLFYQVRDA